MELSPDKLENGKEPDELGRTHGQNEGRKIAGDKTRNKVKENEEDHRKDERAV